MASEILKKFTQKNIPTILSLVGGLVGVASGVPATPEILAALGNSLGNVCNDYLEQNPSSAQLQRAEKMLEIALPLIKEKLKTQSIREDGFFAEGKFSRSSAQEIFEGTLQKVKDTYEYKKISLIANFLVNITFNETCLPAEAHFSLSLVEALIFNELALLKVFASPLNYNLVDIQYGDGRDVHFTTISTLQSINRLASLNLVRMQSPTSKQGTVILGIDHITPAHLSLAVSGKRLYELFDLSLIHEDDAKNAAHWISQETLMPV